MSVYAWPAPLNSQPWAPSTPAWIGFVGDDALLHGITDFFFGDEQARVPARG